MPPGAPTGSLAAVAELLLAPAILLTAGLLLLALPGRRPMPAAVALLAVLGAAGCLRLPWGRLQAAAPGAVPFLARPDAFVTAFHGFLVADGFALATQGIVLGATLLAALLALPDAARTARPGLLFGPLLIAAAGALLAAS